MPHSLAIALRNPSWSQETIREFGLSRMGAGRRAGQWWRIEAGPRKISSMSCTSSYVVNSFVRPANTRRSSDKVAEAGRRIASTTTDLDIFIATSMSTP